MFVPIQSEIKLFTYYYPSPKLVQMFGCIFINICKIKKSNTNSFLQNLLESTSSADNSSTTSNSFGMTEWATDRQCRTLPQPDRSPNPYRLLELQSAHCFCCCFSGASKSWECSNPSFPDGQRNLQLVFYDNYLFSHQASNTDLPQTLNAESFWNTSSTCPENFLKMRDHLMNSFHIRRQSKLDQRTS